MQFKSDVLVAKTDRSVWTCGDSKVDCKPGTEVHVHVLLYSPNYVGASLLEGDHYGKRIIH